MMDAVRPDAVSDATVREVVFELLRAYGMTTIFGNPGSTELPMFRDFPDDFRYVLGLQESIALGMADGYAQATRNAAMVNLHSAAGVGHALGNLFNAYRNHTPLVVTAGQQARSMLPYEPYLFAQDAAEFPKPYVKWSCEPARAQDVPAAISRAYHVAMQVPRGPTFVSIPVDDWDRGAEPAVPRRVSQSFSGDPERLAEVAQALLDARRPVLVAGDAAARDDAWSETIELAERHEMPVWAAPMSGRNSFPGNHRLFAGFLPADRRAITERLAEHDLILVLGAPVFVYHTEGSGPVIPKGARLVQLVDDPAQAASAVTGTAVVSGLRNGIRDLLKAPAPPGKAPVPARAAVSPPDDRVLTDALVLHRIACLRLAGGIVVEEAPSSRAVMHDYLPMVEKDSFYTGSSGGLGYGLPAAVGVALARRDRKVIAVIGDGSSMYSIQSLWSAAQLGLAVSFVILNNRRYRALDGFAHHFGLLETVGTALPDIDFCGLARAQGVDAMRVDRAAALDDALSWSLQASSPSLVEVILDE